MDDIVGRRAERVRGARRADRSAIDGIDISHPAARGFDCLGAANPVVGAITVKGVAYDQGGIEYRLNMARPLVFNGKAETSFTYTQNR